MEPEKATLRQTGLSIKNSWQQFMSAWVQPELDINQRLFALNSGKSGVFGFEEKPFQKFMDEVLGFSEKLCFVEWPFELDAAVQLSKPESSPETISGKRQSFLPPQKGQTGKQFGDKPVDPPLPNKPNLEFSKSNEKESGVFEPGTTGERQFHSQQNGEQNFWRAIEEPLGEINTGNGKNPVISSGKSPSEVHGSSFAGTLAGKSITRPGVQTDSNQKEPNWDHDAGMLHGNGVQNRDSSENSKMKAGNRNPEQVDGLTFNNPTVNLPNDPVFPNPTHPAIKNSNDSQAFYQPKAANGKFIEEDREILPTVKTFQSLGSWLTQNPSGELSDIEIIEKKPPASLPPINLFNSREENQPVIFETYPEADNHIDLSRFDDHSLVRHPNIKPVSGIFENPFHFPGETSNMPDAEDLIRELTEHLNREFKRFYGP